MKENSYKPVKYFTIIFIITWMFWFLSAYFSCFEKLKTIMLITVFLGLLTPFLTALFLIFSSNNQQLKNDFIDKLINIKLIKLKTIPAILLIPPLTVVLSITISLLFGFSSDQFNLSKSFSFQIAAIPTLLVLFLAASLEELGWRGYAIESLSQKNTYFKATFIFGILWSLWHFPLLFINGTYQNLILNINLIYVFNFFAGIVPLAFIISWLSNENNNSILTAILLHFNINISQELFMIENFTKCIQTIILTFAALAVVAANKKKFFKIFSVFAVIFLISPLAQVAEAQGEQEKSWNVSLGIGTIIMPEYEGSNEYELMGVPYFDIKYGDKITINIIDGIRYKLFDFENFNCGTGLGYDIGRDESDAERLNGLGDIDPYLEGILFAEYNFQNTSFGLEFSKDLIDGHGSMRIGLEARHMVTLSNKILIIPSLKLTFADNNYMKSFFGVSNLQSGNSGLPAFDAKAGAKDASLYVPIIYKWTERWSVITAFEYSRLIGDASESPITENKNQFMGGLFLYYEF